MGRIKDLNSALPTENDAFVFDGANGTKRLSYAEFKQKLIDDGFGSGSSEAVVLTQAEYDALPDEVKDSDTIFFISDAPFENSNVVTLTRAQYDALSDATKMDGRFYYITDEAEVTKSLVVQTNVNSTETVPSSAVVYGLKEEIDNSLTNGMFKLKSYSFSYSLSAGSDFHTAFLPSETGYYPLGIIRFSTNDVFVVPISLNQGSGEYSIVLHNTGTGTRSATLQLIILFYKGNVSWIT